MVIQEAIRVLVDGDGIEGSLAAGALEEIMTGTATPAQIGAFLAALRVRGETPETIAACLGVMQAHAEPVKAPNVIDICGTGGDGADTINVSTAAGFVVAAAGVRVAKHGNRAASSKCGSADVLEALGARIDLGGEQIARVIDGCGFCFLFAQRVHPAMRHVGGPRREMGVRTVFNILGPLSNPAEPKRQLVGVGNRALGPLVAEALALRGVERAMIVHSEDGLDEISLATRTHAVELRDGRLSEHGWSPEELGISSQSLIGLDVDSGAASAALIRDALGRREGSHAAKAADLIALNAGAGIHLCGITDTVRRGVALAHDVIYSGLALERIEALGGFCSCLDEA